MKLVEVDKLPEIKHKKLKTGNQGIFYNLKTKDGDNLTLRNFSSSETETKARWTIQIDKKNTKTIELKFQ